MIITETKIGVDELKDGMGTLLVTDAQLIADDHTLLYVGNDMGMYYMHIVCPMGPDEAVRLLDKALHDFVNGCCYDLWCDADIDFYVGEEALRHKEYGFSDGSYTMHINVYCGDDVDVHRHLIELQQNLSHGEPLIVLTPDESEAGFSATQYA